MKTHIIDIAEFREMRKVLLEKITQSGVKYSAILCPLRGGFYICDWISRKLHLPIEYIDISSYKKKKQGKMVISFQPELKKGTYLLCDDIYDSGATIKTIHKLYPHVSFDPYCLVSKDSTAEVGFVTLVDRDTWVDFFWESW